MAEDKKLTTKEKNAAYHAANRDAILVRSRARYALKREADLARKRARRKANPDEGRLYRLAYYRADAEKWKAWARAYTAANQDKKRSWRERHRERLKEYASNWARTNKGLKRAATARRLALKIRATPTWANDAAINAVYQEAARLTKETGVKHEVDHIVPLRSPYVCGLHWEANLQVLTKTENRRKWNRLVA